jgi:hypothetical protein
MSADLIIVTIEGVKGHVTLRTPLGAGHPTPYSFTPRRAVRSVSAE